LTFHHHCAGLARAKELVERRGLIELEEYVEQREKWVPNDI
jgi:hypothetical protein